MKAIVVVAILLVAIICGSQAKVEKCYQVDIDGDGDAPKKSDMKIVNCTTRWSTSCVRFVFYKPDNDDRRIKTGCYDKGGDGKKYTVVTKNIPATKHMYQQKFENGAAVTDNAYFDYGYIYTCYKDLCNTSTRRAQQGMSLGWLASLVATLALGRQLAH